MQMESAPLDKLGRFFFLNSTKLNLRQSTLWVYRIVICVRRKWEFEASFSRIYDVMVVPLLENYRKNRPKWYFRTSKFHYPTDPLWL